MLNILFIFTTIKLGGGDTVSTKVLRFNKNINDIIQDCLNIKSAIRSTG